MTDKCKCELKPSVGTLDRILAVGLGGCWLLVLPFPSSPSPSFFLFSLKIAHPTLQTPPYPETQASPFLTLEKRSSAPKPHFLPVSRARTGAPSEELVSAQLSAAKTDPPPPASPPSSVVPQVLTSKLDLGNSSTSQPQPQGTKLARLSRRTFFFADLSR